MAELGATGKLSLSSFYERRARRLLPALLTVMLFSLPAAWQLLLPEQLVDFSKSLVASLLFASNFYWHFTLQQYGAESALLQPFLHTWSLAVEEQYYIIFPLLLFFIYRWGRNKLVPILCALFIASLVSAHWVTDSDASFSFYMLPTRLWELLAGSLLAVWTLNGFTPDAHSPWQRQMPLLGLLLIVGSVFSFDFNVHHPGLITLIPILGTVLVIAFHSADNWVTRILSWPPAVYFGLLSYSLYLWHYPIFAFGRMLVLEPSLVTKSAWIALTILLSAASYYLVERPFRRKALSIKLFASCLLVAAGVVLCVSSFWIRVDGFADRNDFVVELIADNTQEIIRNDEGRDCLAGMEGIFGLSESCTFDSFPGAKTLVLVGDSHAAALAASLKQLAHTNELNFAQVTHIGCPHIKGTLGWCVDRSEGLRDYLLQFDDPIVVYSARLPLYIEHGEFRNEEKRWNPEEFFAKRRRLMLSRFPSDMAAAVTSSLSELVEDNHRLVLVYPVPEQGFQVSALMSMFSKSISGYDQLPTLSTSYDAFKDRVASSYEALDLVTGPKVSRVYPEHLLCREETNRCMATEAERIYFLTDNHVAALGSDLIASEIANKLDLEIPKSFRR